MTRLGRLCAAAALAGVLGTGSVAQAAGTLAPRRAVAFPQRSFVLTLPDGTAPTPGAIDVAENGRPVDGLRVVPADSRFGVILAIDASASMRGAPMRAAMAAARAFAAQRPSWQALGIVTFNDDVQVVLPPTTNRDAIAGALSRRPALRPDTHMYDAVAVAAKQLGGRRFDGGAVVLVSDGADFGSTSSISDAAAAAKQSSALLFTIGIKSHAFDSSVLQELASGVPGSAYLGSASGGELADIYRAIGGDLGTAYVITYKSLVPAGTAVSVTAGVGNDRASTSYRSPKLSVPGAVAPHRAATHRSFLGSSGGGLLVAGLVFVLVLSAALGVIAARERKISLRRRLMEYGEEVVSTPAALELAGRRRARGGRAEALLANIINSLDIGDVSMTPAGLAARFLVGGAAVGLVLSAAINTPVMFFLTLLSTPLAARMYIRRRVAAQRRLFAEQLADTVQAIVSSLRSGSGLVGAMSQVADRAPQPTAREFRRVVADERLGVPLERALESLVERMDNRDVQQVALVSLLQRDTGGNAAEALERVVDNIRARDDLRRLVTTLTAQGRFAQRALTALPIGTALILTLINAEQMEPLYTTGAGHVALILAALLVLTGTAWIRKIIAIKI